MKERAVRLVFETAASRVSGMVPWRKVPKQLGIGPESLRHWVHQVWSRARGPTRPNVAHAHLGLAILRDVPSCGAADRSDLVAARPGRREVKQRLVEESSHASPPRSASSFTTVLAYAAVPQSPSRSISAWIIAVWAGEPKK